MSAFESILAKVKDPEKREQLKALLEPEAEAKKELEESRMRQEDYSRAMDQLKGADDVKAQFGELQTKYNAAVAENGKWADFEKEIQWDRTSGMTASQKADREELAAQKARVQELEGMVESDDGVGFDAIKQYVDRVAAEKFVTKDELQKFGDPAAAKKETNALVGGMAIGFEDAWAESEMLAREFEMQHNKVFDRKGFISHMRSERTAGRALSPAEAFAEFTKADSEAARKAEEAAREKDVQGKIEAAREEARKEEREKLSMGSDGRIPVDVGLPAGPLEQHLHTAAPAVKTETKEDLSNVPLGRGILAREAAAELAKRDSGQSSGA